MNKLILSSEIYQLPYIEYAIKQFNQLCEIKVERKREAFVCTFFHCKYDVVETIREFENYLIEKGNYS